MTFVGRKARVARLGDSGLEGVEDARVLALAGEAFEPGVEFAGIAFRKLGNRVDAKQVEIAFDGRADGDEIAELTSRCHGRLLFLSLSFR